MLFESYTELQITIITTIIIMW